MKLVALKNIHRYRPGDEFEVNSTQARVLKALGKAKDAPAAAPADPDRDALRAKAAEVGLEIDGRWGTARLRDEIAAAEKPAERAIPRYERRDMRAEEE